MDDVLYEPGVAALDDAGRSSLAADLLTTTEPIQRFLPDRARARLASSTAEKDLSGMRAAAAQAAASAAVIDSVGGVDVVRAAGGLDAIAGARMVYEGAVLNDLAAQLKRSARLVDAGGFSVRVSQDARAKWATVTQPGLTAAWHQAEDALGENVSAQLRDAAFRSRVAGFGRFEDVSKARAAVAESRSLLAAGKVRLSGGDDALASSVLRGEILAQKAGAAIDDSGALLVADDMSLSERLAQGPKLAAVLERHATAMREALSGRGSYFTGPYQATRQAFVPRLEEMRRQLPALRAAVELSSERAVREIDELDALLKQLPQADYNDAERLTDLVARTSRLQASLRSLAQDPQALRARDVQVEAVQALFGDRSSAMNAEPVLRLLQTTSHPRRVGEEILSTMLATRSFNAPPSVPETPERARQLLGEASVLLSAQREARGFAYKSYRLNDPEVRPLVEQVSLRMAAAAAAELPVDEAIRAAVKIQASTLRTAVGKADDLYSRPDYLERALEAVESLDAAVAALLREQSRSGLRTIAPSQRGQAAAASAGSWHLRELAALDAARPSGDDVATLLEHQARELDALAGLAEAGRRIYPSGPKTGVNQTGALYRATVAERLRQLDGLWRMPDDVALRLQRLRVTAAADEAKPWYEGSGFTRSTTPTQLREIAFDLRAWANFTDGMLPSTKTDRLVVAARRAEPLEASMRQLIAGLGEQRGNKFDPDKWVGDVRANADAVLEAARDRLSGGIAQRLEGSLRVVEEDIAAYQAADYTTRRDWMPDYFALGQLQGDVEAAASMLRTQADLALDTV